MNQKVKKFLSDLVWIFGLYTALRVIVFYILSTEDLTLDFLTSDVLPFGLFFAAGLAFLRSLKNS